MDLNYLEIEKLVKKTDEQLQGKRVRKVIEPQEWEILFRMGKEVDNLLFSIKPGYNFFTLTKKKKSRGFSSPFCLKLRKHLHNQVIRSLSLVRKEDRLLKISFSNEWSLIVELLGRHGNILLVDPEDKITGIHHPSSFTTRKLLPGYRYTPPPPHKIPVPQVRFDLKGNIFKEVENKIGEELEKLQREKVYSFYRKQIKKRLKKVKSTIKKVRNEKERHKIHQGFQRVGNLFLIVQYNWKPNEKKRFLENPPDGGEPLELKIPEGIEGPVSAANYYFKIYKKAKRGLDIVKKRLQDLEREKNKLEKEIKKSEEIPFEKLEKFYQDSKQKKKKSSKKPANFSHGFRFFVVDDGKKVYVGRNAQENHKLTFSFANGRDFWLHARNFHGSHVIIPMNRNEELPQQVLIDAAMLALHFSGGSKNRQGEIIYSRKKHLRAVKGEIGKVLTSKSNNITVKIDPQRIEDIIKKSKYPELISTS
ncbi:MAG: NFACT RNA binding domain-containing protein [Myxococcota bacterium]